MAKDKKLKTNAMRILDSKKVSYEMLSYESEDGKIDGISVAHKIGVDEKNVFKTLVAQGTSKELYVFVIPVAEELDLKNIEAIHTRVEEYAKKNIEKYEIVTARAVAHLSILLEYGLPMLKNNYYFIAMKGNLEVEIKESSKALEILNSKIEKIEEFKLPLENSNRTLIKIKKIKSCPKKYPRKPGLPSKEPII